MSFISKNTQNTNNSLHILILAAGKSTRFPGNKLFTPLLGLNIIEHSIQAALKINAKITTSTNNIFLLLSKDLSADQKENAKILAEKYPEITIIYQNNNKGTGAAVASAAEQMPDFENLLVLYADTPLIKSSTLENLITQEETTLLTTETSSKVHQYGKITLNADKYIEKITEYKEKEYFSITSNTISVGSVFFKQRKSELQAHLSLLPTYEHGETYLPDLFKTIPTKILQINEDESLGINTAADYIKASKVLNARILDRFIQEGVLIFDPSTVYVCYDTVLEPGCKLENNICIGTNTVIKSKAHIKAFSYIEGSVIEGVVGPFAHLRTNTIVHEDAKVGSFVETKNAVFEAFSSAKHHNYLGDIHIGANTNIGAGVITCNYVKSTREKHKTIIGENCDIGANTCLIAPINLGDNCQVAAGSVITKDVPENTLAASRTPQKHYRKFLKTNANQATSGKK